MAPFDPSRWPAQLPTRYWLADAHVPAPLLAAPVAGGRAALLVANGRIAAIEARPTGEAPVFELAGATVLSCFVDVHTHLDKGDLLAMGLPPAETLRAAVDVARSDYANWSEAELRGRIGFGLRTAQAHGTRALNTYCDWSGPAAPLAWDVLREAREDWRGRIELHLTALVDLAEFADAARGETMAAAVAASGGRLGLFVYPGIAPQDLQRVFALAVRHGLALDFHIDEHLDPLVSHLALVSELAHATGLGGRTLCSHACVLGALPPPERDAILDRVAQAGVGLVALPYTNFYLQDSARRHGQRLTPRQRGILPVHEARARGIPLAFGSDNHRDPFFPGGDLDPLQLLALATLAAQLDEPLARWSDTITGTPAAMLALDWDGVLAVGAPADLVLHPGRSSAEVLGRATSGRQVLRRGQRLAPADAALPDFRELDGLRLRAAGSPA